MLYPKSHEPMTDALFLNPGSEYRAAPFWAWNCKLEKDELRWQMDMLRQMGFGGAHLHVRTGLETQYLSEEFFSMVLSCVEKAREERMLVWLYDEDRWPSGAAGGLVTKNPAFRQRYALFTRTRRENGQLLAAFDVQLNRDGTLKSYRPMEEDGRARGFALYVYLEIAGDTPWFNNQAYVNTLDPASIRQFLKTTHDAYFDRMGDAFGGVIPAIFTDEPQFSRKQTLAYADDARDVTLPWTDDLPETFRQAYGEELLSGLPELLWDLPDRKISTLRYHFHDHIAERFAQSFADQCGAWCAAHGLMLTGHMMEEPTLESQTAALGEAMRSYRGFQLPGIDMLCDRREYTTAKQAQSASRQFGREGVLSEMYGVTNWDFDFRGHKLQGDWQAALGVTVRVPHLSWVSMKGEAKRDYPATFNYQIPWFREYGYVENHFARLNTALTRGKALCRVGVVHPVESYWLHWGAKESTEAVRAQMDERFQSLTAWLLRGLIDFDFISESLLPIQCPPDFTGSAFPVGEMRYETVLVPPVETLRGTTVARLRRFAEGGGRVIFLGPAPALMDAAPSAVPGALYAACETCPFDRLELLRRLENVRDVEARDDRGVQTNRLLYQMRREGEERWLFLCHADPCANRDAPSRLPLRIRVRGAWSLKLYDTLTGKIAAVPARVEDGWTVYRAVLYDQDSLLLRLSPAREQAAPPSPAKAAGEPEFVRRFLDLTPYTLAEPNVLLLDRAAYALDGEAYAPAEELLRLDNLLRARLGWPLRGGRSAQPWVEKDRTTPHTVRLRYTFRSLIRLEGAELALENAESCAVTLNGLPAQQTGGWYVDKSIGKQALPPILPGENTLEAVLPFGRSVGLEAMYLLGSFGVNIQGVHCTLTPPPPAVAFGDLTRQGFPFYGGNLTYHLTVQLTPGRYCLEASQYRAALLAVKVDGQDAGVLAYAPYRLPFDIAAPGEHAIDLTLFGCRVNTFGQVHQADKTITSWGPPSWRSEGAAWTYEYALWPQGVLKSPELFRIVSAD